MAEYIDKVAFNCAIREAVRRYPNSFYNGLEVARQIAHDFLAADVAPVVRGEWLTGNDNPRTYGRIRAMCGRCGAFALAEMVNAGSYKEQLSNYCPNCGADMRPTSMSGANREES